MQQHSMSSLPMTPPHDTDDELSTRRTCRIKQAPPVLQALAESSWHIEQKYCSFFWSFFFLEVLNSPNYIYILLRQHLENWGKLKLEAIQVRALSRTVPRASLIVKDILGTSCWPSHAATFTLQHSFVPTHLCSKIYGAGIQCCCMTKIPLFTHVSIQLPVVILVYELVLVLVDTC